jgi:hypothetical protein
MSRFLILFTISVVIYGSEFKKKTTKEHTGKQSRIRIRSLKHYSKEGFTDKLEHTDGSELYLCRNVNQAWEMFRKLLHSILSSRTTNYKMVTNVNIIVLHKMWSINKLEDDEIRVDLVNICFQKSILSIFEYI